MEKYFGKSIMACILSVCALAQLTGCVDYPGVSGNITNCDNGKCGPLECSETQKCTGDLVCRDGICRNPVSLNVSLLGKPEVHESSDSSVSFEIKLPSKPSAPVTIHIAVSDDTEIGVDVTEITITPEDWDKPHTVTISGVSDGIVDGDQISSITITAESEDPDYDGLKDDTIRMTTVDDDTCVGDDCPITCEEGKIPSDCPDGMVCDGGICKQPSGLDITMNGKPEVHESPDSTFTFDIQLPSKPSAPVTIHIAVSDDTEIGVDVTEITIDPEDWDKPHTVTVSGVSDGIVDGDQISGIKLTTESDDPDYNNLEDDTIRITTVDDDTCVGDDCPITCEEGKIPSDCPDGMVCDGGICQRSVGLNIALNGAPEVHESPDSTTSFEITLQTKPSAPVTIHIAVSDKTEIGVDVTEITITPEDWDKPHTVTVSGVSDGIVDGDRISGITITTESDDTDYNNLEDDTIRITTIDDDTCVGDNCPTICEEGKIPSDCPSSMVCKDGICQQPASLNIALHGTPEVHESSDSSVTFDVQLPARPLAPVTIHITVSDDTEIGVDITEITITPEDWDKPHTVTISGVSDDIVDGNQISIITLEAESEDPDYNGLTNDSLHITTIDDNTATLQIASNPETLSENGGTTTFTFQLTSQPQGPVTVDLSSSSSSLAVAEPTTITINPEDWDKPVTVTLATVDDEIADGTRTAQISLTATSSDPNYNGVTGTTAVYTIADDEHPSIVLSAATTELVPGNYSTTITAVLSNEPTAPVTVTLTTSDPNLAQPETVTLVFTPENWNTEQVVSVSAVDISAMEQAVADATIQGTATSDCENYSGLESNELAFKIYAYIMKEYSYPPDVKPEDKECVTEFETLLPGSYKLQVWGASGGDQVGLNQNIGSHAGLGGYAEGILTLTEKTDIAIHVGSMGFAGTLEYGENAKGGGCNGGGGGTQSSSTGANGFGGGGSSDIRIGGDTYYHRVIVAGGGGGTDDGTEETADVVGGWNDGSGGYGGGEISGQGYREGKLHYAASTDKSGYRFGEGESAAGTKTKTSDTGGGGGGWFGGYAGADHNSGGSGGSGYIYTSTAYVVEGYLVDPKYQLTEAQTIAGNQSFPSISGNDEEVGHKGDGFVRISLVK